MLKTLVWLDGKILITCPLNWKSDDRYGQTIIEAAVNSNFFPLYEVEQGETTITYDPEGEEEKDSANRLVKMDG